MSNTAWAQRGDAARSTSNAEPARPVPSPLPPPIPSPRDVPYPGVIALAVDATDLTHHIFTVHETVPVAGAGRFTLLYPQWIPGHHSPNGPLDKMAGLVVHANGQRVEWQRDPVQVFAFHIDVPQGAASLDIDFQFASPVTGNEGRVVMTPDMLNLQWNTVALYPAGFYSRQIEFAPSVTLPPGWQFGTALTTASTSGDTTRFEQVPFNTLVDSPLLAGRYFKHEDLDPGAATPVRLDIVADRPDLLTITPAQLAAHRALVQQAYKLFGSHHYDHYDFLLALSDKLGGTGLEHHRSSEDATVAKYFVDWDGTADGRDLLAHEYTHSWNGKFRRPADLWTPSFGVPMRDSLLWVYEGQTQYWGYVLAARSGLLTAQQALDAIALTAATYDRHVGRAWRDLQDTTNDPIIANRRPMPWRSWQRREDYYSEGALTWLDADTLIRRLSRGKRSLDDFARAFFGIDNGSYVTVTYDFDAVVAALNAVQPYDWAAFLNAHLRDHAAGAPLDGLTRGGYRLIYNETESPMEKGAEKARQAADFRFSLGMVVGRQNMLTDVEWGGAAFQAGLTVGTKLVAVNGQDYAADDLKDAITWAKTHPEPLSLLVEDDGHYRTVTIDYHDGLRHPHLEPLGKGTRTLDAILAPRK